MDNPQLRNLFEAAAASTNAKSSHLTVADPNTDAIHMNRDKPPMYERILQSYYGVAVVGALAILVVLLWFRPNIVMYTNTDQPLEKRKLSMIKLTVWTVMWVIIKGVVKPQVYRFFGAIHIRLKLTDMMFHVPTTFVFRTRYAAITPFIVIFFGVFSQGGRTCSTTTSTITTGWCQWHCFCRLVVNEMGVVVGSVARAGSVSLLDDTFLWSWDGGGVGSPQDSDNDDGTDGAVAGMNTGVDVDVHVDVDVGAFRELSDNTCPTANWPAVKPYLGKNVSVLRCWSAVRINEKHDRFTLTVVFPIASNACCILKYVVKQRLWSRNVVFMDTCVRYKVCTISNVTTKKK